MNFLHIFVFSHMVHMHYSRNHANFISILCLKFKMLNGIESADIFSLRNVLHVSKTKGFFAQRFAVICFDFHECRVIAICLHLTLAKQGVCPASIRKIFRVNVLNEWKYSQYDCLNASIVTFSHQNDISSIFFRCKRPDKFFGNVEIVNEIYCTLK